MNNWVVVIQNQPLLKNIYTKPPIVSYKRGKSLNHTGTTSSFSKIKNNQPSEVLVSPNIRPSFCYRGRLNFQVLAMRDIKMAVRGGFRIGQKRIYRSSFCTRTVFGIKELLLSTCRNSRVIICCFNGKTQ